MYFKGCFTFGTVTLFQLNNLHINRLHGSSRLFKTKEQNSSKIKKSGLTTQHFYLSLSLSHSHIVIVTLNWQKISQVLNWNGILHGTKKINWLRTQERKSGSEFELQTDKSFTDTHTKHWHKAVPLLILFLRPESDRLSWICSKYLVAMQLHKLHERVEAWFLRNTIL